MVCAQGACGCGRYTRKRTWADVELRGRGVYRENPYRELEAQLRALWEELAEVPGFEDHARMALPVVAPGQLKEVVEWLEGIQKAGLRSGAGGASVERILTDVKGLIEWVHRYID